jgi:hypothetical protein
MKNTSAIKDKESLARYIFSPMHIKKGRLRWQAFKPKNGETSVTRQDFTSQETVVSLGKEIAKRSTFLRYKGKADIAAKEVFTLGLDVTPAPTERDNNHANIVKWPKEKDERIDLCKELLMKSSFGEYN